MRKFLRVETKEYLPGHPKECFLEVFCSMKPLPKSMAPLGVLLKAGCGLRSSFEDRSEPLRVFALRRTPKRIQEVFLKPAEKVF